MILDKLGGRKFSLTIVVMLIGTVVQCCSSHGVSTEYAALMVGLLTSFHVSNAYVTGATASISTDDAAAPRPPPVDVQPLYSAINAIAKSVEELHAAKEEHAKVLTTVQQGIDVTQKLARAAVTLSGAAG